MIKLCDECETVAHCLKHGCIPKQTALNKKAENARELGLDYEPIQCPVCKAEDSPYPKCGCVTYVDEQRAWFTIDELNAWADKKLKENPQWAEQPAQQEQGDSICQEDDGCPTEKAVLQRFWRGQSIPDEHYPAWFKPAQQEPVAWRTFDGEGGYEYRSYDMNEQYAQEWEQRNPKHKGWVEPLYTSPPARRTWVGLDEKDFSAINQSCLTKLQAATSAESILKEKNT